MITMIKNFLLVLLLSLSAIGLVHADPVLETTDKLQKSCGGLVDIKTTEGRFLFPYQTLSAIKVARSKLTDTVHLYIKDGSGTNYIIVVPDNTKISDMVDKLC